MLIFILKILGYQDGVAAGPGFDLILETVLENGAKHVATSVSILHPIKMAHRTCLSGCSERFCVSEVWQRE